MLASSASLSLIRANNKRGLIMHTSEKSRAAALTSLAPSPLALATLWLSLNRIFRPNGKWLNKVFLQQKLLWENG